MNKELIIRLSIPRELVEWCLIATLLAVLPASVGSEVVTLNTYYPAPYGIYTQMRTTGQTTLAESAGDVGIGLTSPVNKLDVSGAMAIGTYAGSFSAPTDGLLVSGQVGIGTTNPSAAVVTGDNAAYGLNVQGNYPNINARSIHVNTSGCTQVYVYDGNNSYPPGASPPASPYVPDTSSSAQCGSGQYATWVPGLRVEGQWYQPRQVWSASPYGPTYSFFYMSGDTSGSNPQTPPAFIYFDETATTFFCCPD